MTQAAMAVEVSRRLLERQNVRILEAEARLEEERRKLVWVESLAGDLGTVLKEVLEERGDLKVLQPPLQAQADPAAPEVIKQPNRPLRTLKEQEILEFADRMEGPFTPQDLLALVEACSSFRVAVKPLQLALSRMAQAGKGLLLLKKGGRWQQSSYVHKDA